MALHLPTIRQSREEEGFVVYCHKIVSTDVTWPDDKKYKKELNQEKIERKERKYWRKKERKKKRFKQARK